MSKSKVRHLRPAQKQQQPPTNIAAQMTITAYTDRPLNVVCTGPPTVALQLLAVALKLVADDFSQPQLQNMPQLPVEDKPREYLGPRKYEGE